MKNILFDIEANGLLDSVSKVWCAVLYDLDTNTTHTFTEDKILTVISILEKAETLVGHNIIHYDIPVLKKLYNLNYQGRIQDTLLLSKIANPDRKGGHSLEAWGERLGFSKIEFNDFSKFSDEMMVYCVRDVELNVKVYNKLISSLKEYCPSKVFDAFDMENKFASIMELQMNTGFKLDVEKTKSRVIYFKSELAKLIEECNIELMDYPIRITSHYDTVKKKGNLISSDDSSYTYLSRGKEATRVFQYKYRVCTSRKQMIDYFIYKGWDPEVFTEKGNPILNETTLQSVNHPLGDKILKVYKLIKDLGMMSDGVNAWLKLVKEDSRVYGRVNTIGANTSRLTHSKPNMSQVAKSLRDLWIADDEYSLVGVDASSLELRVLGHYLYPFDNGSFSFEVSQGDVHTFNQNAAGLSSRDSAKTLIYGLVYGAGDVKIGKIFCKDQDINETNEVRLKKYGREVRARIEDNLKGYKELTNLVKERVKERGYLIGIDGRPLHPRSEHSALNLLIQSTGAILMKKVLVDFYKKLIDKKWEYGVHYKLVGNIHDEIQSEVNSSLCEEYAKMLVHTFPESAASIGLRGSFTGEYKIGRTWKETH